MRCKFDERRDRTSVVRHKASTVIADMCVVVSHYRQFEVRVKLPQVNDCYSQSSKIFGGVLCSDV